MQIVTTHNINDRIDQSLDDTLALMKRFEETGMDTVMKEDYLALYDIYKRLQEQKEGIRSVESSSGVPPILR